MQLKPPKRTPEGFYLVVDPVLSTPEIRWDRITSTWECSSDMMTWLATLRSGLLGELVSHGNWFSRPPRRDTLETLFAHWSSPNTLTGGRFVCATPSAPEDSSGNLYAVWSLEGILMSASAISPVWSIQSIREEPADAEDTITLFEDGRECGDNDTESREIQFHEIETAHQAGPTKLKGREWETRKFLGKERVREARLKAQIAKKIARKEESRYYEQFGDPEDGESRISDFDLTDSESDADDESTIQ